MCPDCWPGYLNNLHMTIPIAVSSNWNYWPFYLFNILGTDLMEPDFILVLWSIRNQWLHKLVSDCWVATLFFMQILSSTSIYFSTFFGSLIPLLLKPRCSSYDTSYANLQPCPFLPVIWLAVQHSGNCSRGLESCKDDMPLSSRQPDPLVRKAPQRSPKHHLGAIFFYHLWVRHKDFSHILYQSSWSRWIGSNSWSWNHVELLVWILCSSTFTRVIERREMEWLKNGGGC